MARTNMTVLLVSILITLLHSYLPHGLELKDYQTLLFSNPNGNLEFTRLAIHNETGNVYIGGGNRLYRLAANFERQQQTEPYAKECNEDVCPINYNKVLLVDYRGNKLVTCGSESIQENSGAVIGGTCQTRSLDDVTALNRDDDDIVVAPGKLSTEAVIAPGPDNGGVDTLYVAATYDDERYDAVKPVSRRTYAAAVTSDLIFYPERDAETLLSRQLFPKTPFLINYVYGFVNEHKASSPSYTYFVTSQKQDWTTINDKNYVSKINRVCQGFNFDSYAEITLECQGVSPNDKYNLVQAAYVGPAGADLAASLGLKAGDDVLYGVFAKNEGEDGNIPSNQSALCIYKLEDIEEKFVDAILGCLRDGKDDYGLAYLFETDCLGAGADKINRDNAIAQQCTALNWANADESNPLVSTAVVEWSDITPSSIITTTHRSHTVAFVGTTDGQLVKTHILSADDGREYERFSLGSSSSPSGQVLRDGIIDNDKEHFTILTEQKVLKLVVSNCGAYTTCDECIGDNGEQDGDPYCGWCTLKKKCTRHDECDRADESTRWLPYNNAQCVAISNVAPYSSQPITSVARQIILTVEQLPDLASGQNYQCVFDDVQLSPATKEGNMLTCVTPVVSERPPIPAGSDHVTMMLNVHSTETDVKFVSTEYAFYECDTHKMCVACTNSSWACDWCIYSNKCTHDNRTCSMEDDISSIINGINNPEVAPRQGLEECPQLADQGGEILIPVGVSRSITVTGMNLPDEDRVTSYKCKLSIDGIEEYTAAMQSGEEIICPPRMYALSKNIQDLDVSFTVVWNDNRELDDVFGFKVTLYKCEVDRPDCSRCLSTITTRPELVCGWCKTNGMCTVDDNSQCSGEWLAPGSNENCPAPVLSGVWPPSGPHEGNTVISITGTDLGQKFDDVVSVMIGNRNCGISEFSQQYMVASSVSCRTPDGITDSDEDITVTVRGANGMEQQSTGKVVFTYRNPSISSFEPQEGPEAGGTIVTITGQYLDACSEISAAIGSECTMNRKDNVLNVTTATCRTTRSSVDSIFPLVVSFDGAMRQSQDMYTYRPNPIVTDVQPLKTILSGGITLTVTGTGFNLTQTPQIIMYVAGNEITEECEVQDDTMMLCKTPNTKTSSDSISRRKRQVDPLGEASFGFIIGDVSDLLMWAEDNNVTIAYFPDPEYILFEENPRLTQGGSIEQILGRNLDAGSSEGDVTVYIGTEVAVVETLDESILAFTIPDEDPGQTCITGNMTKDTCVVVKHGNLPQIYIGTIRYPSSSNEIGAIIGPIIAACVILIVIILLVLLVYILKVKGHKENVDKLLIHMQELETNIADDIHDAFVKLQTDVTDLTSDLEGTGMPFVPHRQYAIGMFFTGLDNRPMTNDPEDCDETVENAMEQLSTLLSDKDFLMALIQILDDDKTVPNKDRLSIASMLTVLMILEDKLPYLTDVMVTLMTAQVQDAIEAEKPTILFQRTELIMEKLLSNWIALSLYDFLKDHAAFPLFLLYRAIKCQTEKGPIDIVTGKSYISLNDENIISERLKFNELTLHVVVNKEDGEQKEVTVLDTDSIGQVKSKILDVVYRNMPYSARMQPWQVDLEWLHGQSGHLVLQDIDVSSDKEPGYKRINTLGHYSVPTGSNFALPEKQEVPNAQVAGQGATKYCNVRNSANLPNISVSMTDAQVEEGVLLWHLVKGDDEVQEAGDRLDTLSKRKSLSTLNKRKSIIQKKHIREVTFPRLLGTKGIVQEYMDKMFAAILNTEDVPIGIKYIFDVFDGLARRHDIQDEAVLHKWKSNILPLRFWQNIITNPQIIFDINQCESVEASLSVISQAFYDAFRINDDKIAKNAAYRRLLYNRELPKYRGMVKEYYSSVTNMQRIGKATLDQDLKDICTKFTGLFSRLSTLIELHKFLVKYRTRLLEALDSDEVYAESGVSKQLEDVLDLLPQSGNDPRYVYGQQVDLGDESAASNGKM